MLRELRISGLGVIDDATLPLAEGLTVLTGETGAGKTMVVQALGLLTGARADAGLVRTGASRTVVEALVDLPSEHPALVRAAEAGADPGEDLVLVRTVSSEGRSRAHVGGRSAPVGTLAEVAGHLVAIHGQADQWRLRQAEEHRELVDTHGGPDLLDLRERHRAAHDELAAVESELDLLRTAARDRARELEVLELGLEQIEAVDPRPGEDEALRAESVRLSGADALRGAATAAAAALSGDEDAPDPAPDVLGLLARARTELESAGRTDPAAAALAARATELGHLAADLASDVAGYLASLETDPARQEQVEQRRAAIGNLLRKYGDDVAAVLEWARAAAARVETLRGSDDRIEDLRARAEELRRTLSGLSADLTALRRRSASALADAVTRELAALAMGSAVVTVDVSPRTHPVRDGADDVEIRLAANPGSPGRSVTRAASGGELSRVMLAIEVATAGESGPRPTFVFDEVDAGVGGRAALAVGSRLAELARSAQVVVVTHLPQVAAYADRHLVVTKATDGTVTASGVVEVRGAEREAELARMMTGVDSDTARAHARELLGAAAHGRA